MSDPTVAVIHKFLSFNILNFPLLLTSHFSRLSLLRDEAPQSHIPNALLFTALPLLASRHKFPV
jgi:hypothetical protein